MTSLLERKQLDYPNGFSHFIQSLPKISYWEPGKFWLVTTFDAAREALADPALSCDRTPFFLTRMPDLDLRLIPDFLRVVKGMMVMSDDADHRDKRRICYQGFTGKIIDEFKPKIERTVSKLLGSCDPIGFDFVEKLAGPLPSITLAEFFNIDDTLRTQLYRWSNTMTQFFGGASRYQNEDGVEVNDAAANLHALFKVLIAERRRSPGEDFISTILRHQRHFGLDDEALISQAIMMLVAGQVTTTDQASHNLYQFLQHELSLGELADNPMSLESAIEEATRLDPAVTFLFRVARHDTVIGEQIIRSGNTVFISTHAVNRDAAAFESPSSFRINRERNTHLSYGYGAHFCLGAKLARLEMQTLFRMLFERFPRLVLGEHRRRHSSLAFSGFEVLRIQPLKPPL